MFDDASGLPSAEQLARLDQRFAHLAPSDTPQTRAVIDRICSSSRAENQAAAARLAAISELDVLRLREFGDCESLVDRLHGSRDRRGGRGVAD